MKWPFDLKDFYTFVGMGLLSYGLAKIYPPLALVFLGILFLRLAVRSTS